LPFLSSAIQSTEDGAGDQSQMAASFVNYAPKNVGSTIGTYYMANPFAEMLNQQQSHSHHPTSILAAYPATAYAPIQYTPAGTPSTQN
jgi:hypothetical protein